MTAPQAKTSIFVTATCAVCRTQFTRRAAWTIRRSGYEAGKFCSLTCAKKGQRHPPRTMIEATCIKCGTRFQYKKGLSGPHRYCSRKCSWADRSRRFSGANAPGWKGGVAPRTHAVKAVIAAAKREQRCCERCGSTDNLQGHHRELHSVAPLLRACRENIEVLCATCHAEKHPELANMILRPHRRSGVMAQCQMCGKAYYVKASHTKKTRWCSRACLGKSKRRRHSSALQ